MELTILTLIRSFRERNFTLYRESLSELIPYLFANNNINYARWLPIHLRYMMCLEKQHPYVAREFHQGNFVVHKSNRNLSAMAIDQAHKQNNAVIKGDGGDIGLTENPSALRRWMEAGPELSRLVANHKMVSGTKDAKKSNRHHEQTETVQRAFFEKVKQLTTVMEETGNPFEDESGYLLLFDTKDIADPSAAQLIATHHERGKES